MLIIKAHCFYHLTNEMEISDESFNITLYDYTRGLRTDLYLKRKLRYDSLLGYVIKTECLMLPKELWAHITSIKTYNKCVMVYTDEFCESEGIEYNIPKRVFLGDWLDPKVKAFRSC